jgi:hypothetical protein
VGDVAHTLALGTTANTITFPNVASDTVVMLAAAQTLTGKSIAASQITAGTFAAGTFSFSGSTITTLGTVSAGTLADITGFGLRDTTAAFDVTVAATSTSATLTAGRTLTLDVGNVAHTLALGTTANTITFPNIASGTVAMLNASQTFTGIQTFNSNVLFKGSVQVTGASFAQFDQPLSTLSRLTSNGPDASSNGILRIATMRSDASNDVTVADFQAGVQVGAPTGGDKGAGTLNAATDLYRNGTALGYPLSATRPNQALTNSAAADADFTSVYTIPANFLTAQKWLRLTITFTYTTGGTASSQQHYLKLGATKVLSFGAATPGNSITRNGVATYYIIGTAAAGAAVTTDIMGASTFNNSVNLTAIGTLATNGTLTIVPGLTWGSNSNADTITLLDVLVEALT